MRKTGRRDSISWQKKEARLRGKNAQYAAEQPLLQQPKLPNDRLEWLFKEINKMDKVERSLALLLLDGFSYKEMAEVLGLSESNVGVKIYRIKKRLTERAKQLEHHGL